MVAYEITEGRTMTKQMLGITLSAISFNRKYYKPVSYPALMFTIITIAVAVISVCACSAEHKQDYFPISESSRWEYKARVVFENGKAVNGTVVNYSAGEVIIQGKRYIKYISTTEFYTGASTTKNSEVSYYRIASDGVYKIDDKHKDQPEYLEMPLPIPIGLTWISQSPGRGEAEVHAENAGSVEVNGRKYEGCLKVVYRLKDAAGTIDYYLAPDIGIVKGVITKSSPITSTTEVLLQKYEP